MDHYKNIYNHHADRYHWLIEVEGIALSQKIRANNWARLPEWTGVWAKVGKGKEE